MKCSNDAGMILRQRRLHVSEGVVMSATDRNRLKEDFQRTLGFWGPEYDQLLDFAPEYFRASLDYLAAPWRTGPLPPKVRELIYVTLNVSTTHLNERALRQHISNALAHGATAAEIMEVFQIISILGGHCLSMPILTEELQARGREINTESLSPYQEEVKRLFQTSYIWTSRWDTTLALMPNFLEAHVRVFGISADNTVLGHKVRELVSIAVDASTTHLWAGGVRSHIQAALEHGATEEEIAEVLQLTAMLGTQSVTFGLPILIEEMVKAGKGVSQ
jgi:alkylhydroperoxidase/carboxymuconolactone decarboxylase family protein YurZ